MYLWLLFFWGPLEIIFVSALVFRAPPSPLLSPSVPLNFFVDFLLVVASPAAADAVASSPASLEFWDEPPLLETESLRFLEVARFLAETWALLLALALAELSLADSWLVFWLLFLEALGLGPAGRQKEPHVRVLGRDVTVNTQNQ